MTKEERDRHWRRRNKIAKELQKGQYQPKVEKDKTKYNRKKSKINLSDIGRYIGNAEDERLH